MRRRKELLTRNTPSQPTTTKLDFIHSGRIAERIGKSLQQSLLDFFNVVFYRRRVKKSLVPQLPSHRGDGIREGGAFLSIPGRLSDRQGSAACLPICQE